MSWIRARQPWSWTQSTTQTARTPTPFSLSLPQVAFKITQQSIQCFVGFISVSPSQTHQESHLDCTVIFSAAPSFLGSLYFNLVFSLSDKAEGDPSSFVVNCEKRALFTLKLRAQTYPTPSPCKKKSFIHHLVFPWHSFFSILHLFLYCFHTRTYPNLHTHTHTHTDCLLCFWAEIRPCLTTAAHIFSRCTSFLRQTPPIPSF